MDPFSIVNTPRCTGRVLPTFSGLLHFTLDPYLIMLNVKQSGIRYYLAFGMSPPKIELRCPRRLARICISNKLIS